MDVTETLNEGLARSLKIIVPAGDIESRVDAKLSELGASVRLPGFRPGKVPMSILKQRFGNSVMGEALEATVNESTEKVLSDRGFRPAGSPKVEISKYEPKGDLEFTVELEILPEIEPMDFSKLEIEKLKPEVGEEEVDKALERVAADHKQFEAVSEARPAKEGDAVLIDFEGFLDGNAFEGGAGTDFQLELGSGRFIPGFEEQLTGWEPGKEGEINVTFPADYGAEQLAGKEAVFKVTVKEVREAKDTTVDDEFAKSLGLDSLEQLRQRLKEQAENEWNNVARMRLKRQLLDKLAEHHDFEIPSNLAEAEFEGIWRQVKGQAGHDHDHGHDHNHDHDHDHDHAHEQQAVTEPANEEEAKEQQEYRDIAARRVRLGLLLSEVGRLNNINVSEEELRQGMIREAMRYQDQAREALEFFQKTPEAMAQIRAPIFEDKVVDFILELAQVSERPITVDELTKEMEAEDAQES